MGVKSSGSFPTTTKADGHLLEYSRTSMGAGGGANSGPTFVPSMSASGGTKTTSGNYTIHTFTSSGAFTVEGGSGSVEYLVIAAGGGGGGYGGGVFGSGGGAGGYRSNVPGQSSGGGASAEAATATITPGTYPVVIGSGGSGGGPGNSAGGTGGSASSLNLPSAISSVGGGGGSRDLL